MKIKKGFILKDVAGNTFVVAVGSMSKKFNGIITLNETAKLIWQCLVDGAEKEEIVEKIMNEYDAEREIVEKDVDSFIAKLDGDGILE